MEYAALILWACVTAVSTSYWYNRAEIEGEELEFAMGGQLILSSDEIKANQILMTMKNAEFDTGYANHSLFLPAHIYYTVVEDIRKSNVYKFIKRLPKGSNLHIHDFGMTSAEFTYNLTFRENLYICEDNDTFSFKFFDQPDNSCQWQLLSSLRKNASNPDDLERYIKGKINLIVDDPINAWSTPDKAFKATAAIVAIIMSLVTFKPVFVDYFTQALQEAIDDNLSSMEIYISLAPLYELDGTQYGPEDIIRIYKEVNDRFVQSHPEFLGVKLIYQASPRSSLEVVKEHLELFMRLHKAFPSFLVGFDLVGQEDYSKPLAFYAEELRKSGAEYYFHVGNVNWYGQPADNNLFDAVLLNSRRIVHGYAMTKHPVVTEMMERNGTCVVISPLVDQLDFATDLRNHPAIPLIARNFPLATSSGRPGLWAADTLSDDFYMTVMGMMSRKADLRALKQLAKNSLQYSTMNATEKEKALEVWNSKWNTFIADVIADAGVKGCN